MEDTCHEPSPKDASLSTTPTLPLFLELGSGMDTQLGAIEVEDFQPVFVGKHGNYIVVFFFVGLALRQLILQWPGWREGWIKGLRWFDHGTIFSGASWGFFFFFAFFTLDPMTSMVAGHFLRTRILGITSLVVPLWWEAKSCDLTRGFSGRPTFPLNWGVFLRDLICSVGIVETETFLHGWFEVRWFW